MASDFNNRYGMARSALKEAIDALNALEAEAGGTAQWIEITQHELGAVKAERDKARELLQLHRDARKTLADAYVTALMERNEARTLVGRAYSNIEQGCKGVAWMLDAKAALEEWQAQPPQPADEPTRDWQVPPPPRTDLLAAIGDIVVSYFRSCGRCLLCKGVNQEHGEYCGVAIYLRSVEVREPADEPTSLQRATAAVLDEAGMTLADEPKGERPVVDVAAMTEAIRCKECGGTIYHERTCPAGGCR